LRDANPDAHSYGDRNRDINTNGNAYSYGYGYGYGNINTYGDSSTFCDAYWHG
jgi:hypothetical protein